MDPPPYMSDSTLVGNTVGDLGGSVLDGSCDAVSREVSGVRQLVTIKTPQMKTYVGPSTLDVREWRLDRPP